jgi:hypothetical protein
MDALNDAYALLGIRIVCAMTDVFKLYVVFDIKTFDHINDSLLKSVTKDTKHNTPEQQLWHSHHTVYIRQAYQNIPKK